MVQGGALQQAIGDFNAAIGYLAKGNNDKAFGLFQKSALAGHVGAAYYLADMYSDGSGTTQNYAEAYVWASVAAAESGNADADKAAQSRDAYAKFLSLETLNAAQQRADILFRETRAKRTPGKELTN
jgi:TPR repeat protein